MLIVVCLSIGVKPWLRNVCNISFNEYLDDISIHSHSFIFSGGVQGLYLGLQLLDLPLPGDVLVYIPPLIENLLIGNGG